MEPITVLSIISAGAFVYDKWRQSRNPGSSLEKFKLPSAAGPTPEIGPAELESFTGQLEGGLPDGQRVLLRHFDRRVSDGMLPHYATSRSAIPIPSGPITPISPGARVYRVMPLQPGVPTVAEVLEPANREQKTVLGSLSLIGLGWGSSDPMLIVVGGPELHVLVRAMPRGDFALLDAPKPRVVVLDPAAEVVSEGAGVAAAPAPTPAPEPTKAASKAAAKAAKEHLARNGAANGVDPAHTKAAPAAPTEKSEG